MKRLLFILLLSGIFCSAAAQELTYEQLQSFKSKDEYKNLKFTSYVASDGNTYTIGDEITVGHKSAKLFYLYIASRMKLWHGDHFGERLAISAFDIGGSVKKGLYVKIIFLGKGLLGAMCYPFDLALLSGEIIGKVDSADSGQDTNNDIEQLLEGELSFSTLNESEGGYFNAYIASNGDKFIVDETEVTIGNSFNKSFEYVNARTDKSGLKARVQSIYLKPKSKKKNVVMVLRFGSTAIEVTSVEDALALGEIFIERQ